jgi:hypothetical protein
MMGAKSAGRSLEPPPGQQRDSVFCLRVGRHGSLRATAAAYGTSTPHLATAVMGHRDKRITEEHYNRARSFHAGAILADIIETCKSSG